MNIAGLGFIGFLISMIVLGIWIEMKKIRNGEGENDSKKVRDVEEKTRAKVLIICDMGSFGIFIINLIRQMGDYEPYVASSPENAEAIFNRESPKIIIFCQSCETNWSEVLERLPKETKERRVFLQDKS